MPLRNQNRSRLAVARGKVNVEREVPVPPEANESRYRDIKGKYLCRVR